MSPQALLRREQFGIPVTEADLPVDPANLEWAAKHGKLRYSSRWLNAAFLDADSSIARQLRTHPEVISVEFLGPIAGPQAKIKATPRPIPKLKPYPNAYGESIMQIVQLRLQWMHAMGFKGKDIAVGVMDGGFTGVPVMPAFEKARADGRLVMETAMDYVDLDRSPWEGADHGTEVLSTILADIPHLYVGTAPQASAICVKTEDTRSETKVEEANIVAALEYLDQAGADVVNASLGYVAFDDKKTNYRHHQMNGKTSLASRAADMAVDRGINVVVSVGNSGDGWWGKLGVPSDGEKVMAVGSVDHQGNKSAFSSFGPSGDGRIKPNVMAYGEGIAVINYWQYQPHQSAGTSFAAPVMAGMVACFRQAFPEADPETIRAALENSGNMAQRIHTDSIVRGYGYGIPDAVKAFKALSGIPDVRFENTLVIPDKDQQAQGYIYTRLRAPIHIVLENALGQRIAEQFIPGSENLVQHFQFDLQGKPAGIYQVKWYSGTAKGSQPFQFQPALTEASYP